MVCIIFENLETILVNTCRYEGNKQLIFDGFKPIMECNQHQISWIRPGLEKAELYVNNTKAGCIVCDELTFKLYHGSFEDKLFLITNDPFLAVAKILKKYFQKNETSDINHIHPTAIIHPNCKLGNGVKIGAYSIIDECEIGDNTMIESHVTIFDNVYIGSNCYVREFCTIGGQGFRIIKDENGINMHVPHIGKVIIGDNVLISQYTTVDRGLLGDTIIESNAAIGLYCHASHNTFFGKNSIMTVGVVLGGGSKIKNDSYLGLHTIIKPKVEVGVNVTTGMGAVVTHNIPDNETWVGNPAKNIIKFLSEKNNNK